MDRFIRTDLALELREDIIKKKKNEKEDAIEGVKIYTNERQKGLIETRIEVVNKEGEMLLGKPVGNYITLESKELKDSDESIHKPLVEALHKNIKILIQDAKKVLVIGLGNREVTPDALGPFVIDNLYVTRHLINEGIVKNVKEISAISPGVMAQTGIEAQTILKALCNEIKPDVVIAVDALAAREPSRLNTTIQICDTGISPGAGVGNNRMKLNKDTLGVKVIAIGVPTVISVPAIINEAIEGMVSILLDTKKEITDVLTDEEKYKLACDLLEPDLATMFVTPKNIDESVKRVSYTISEAINKFIEL